MSRRFVDLSIRIENEIKSDPPHLQPSIEYHTHKETAPLVAKRYDDLAPEGLVDGEGYAIEFVKLNTHCGTHVDAPWHFASTMDRGKPAAKIDEIPLDWFYGDGARQVLPTWLKGADRSNITPSHVTAPFRSILRDYADDFVKKKIAKVFCNECRTYISDVTMDRANKRNDGVFDLHTVMWHCPAGHLLRREDLGYRVFYRRGSR